MKYKRISYDIPASLDRVLSVYAKSVTAREDHIIAEAIARHTLTTLLRKSTYDATVKPTLTRAVSWFENHHDALKPYSLTPADVIAHVVITIPGVTVTPCAVFTVTPCKRTTHLFSIPSELAILMGKARHPMTARNFIDQAVFNELEHKLLIGVENMNQEYIEAETPKEQRALLAELRELKGRITTLEAMFKPSTASSELIAEVLISLINQTAKGNSHNDIGVIEK